MLDEEIRRLQERKKQVGEEEINTRENYEKETEKHERFLRRHKAVQAELQDLDKQHAAMLDAEVHTLL